jgi:hypothetical protein
MGITARITALARRWRVARYERRRLTESLHDERAAEHTRRQREGIRDVHPGAAGP